MKRNDLLKFHKSFDWGILFALLVGLFAAWPLWSNPGLPEATDAELHIYRIAELGFSLRAGNLYPRWAPDFFHGHGYPIFNYYAPLTYHLGNWLTALQPQFAAFGAKALFIIAHALGSLGAYLLGREFGDQSGGVLGAAAFAFSPYILIINPHIRGDLAEVFALSVVPWALWSWERLWEGGGRSNFVLAVITASVTLLSHNLTGLTLMLLLFALSVWHWLLLKQSNCFWQALLAGTLVAALTAYFWLPFLVERQFIQLDVAGSGHYDYHNHFVRLSELVALVPPLDWGAAALQVPMTASPLLIGLAIIGWFFNLIANIRTKTVKPQTLRLLFYLLSGSFCFFLITSSSEWVWDTLPGLNFFQFPWRFLGPLMALGVPLIASWGRISMNKTWSQTLIIALLWLIVIAGMSGLYPAPWTSGFDKITPATIINAELKGRWRGTTSTNDFVPVSVDMIPGPQESVLSSYETSSVDRVNRFTLPKETVVSVLTSLPWQNRFWVQSQESFTLRLYLFHFPGWKAYIDDIEVPIDLARPEGFITVKVPSGEHEVTLRFEDTSIRSIGWYIALAGLLVFLVACWHFPTRQLIHQHTFGSMNWAFLSLVALVLFKGGIADATSWFHFTSSPGEALPAQYQQKASFNNEIAVLGFDLSAKRLYPGQSLDVTLYWQAEQKMEDTYQTFVHLVYPEGTIWAQSDHLNPGGFPTNLWPTDRYVWAKHQLTLPPNAPPGDYFLSIGVYRLQEGQRLPVTWASYGQRADNLVLLKPIRVRVRKLGNARSEIQRLIDQALKSD